MADPKTPNNPALKQAMGRLKAKNTPQNLNVVLNELTRATFLAPATIDLGGRRPLKDANGRVILPPDTKLNFLLLSDPAGQKYYMAFTDWTALRRWKAKGEQQTITLRFDDFANMLAKNGEIRGIVVNPFAESLRFESKMILEVKRQRDEAIAKRKEQAPLKRTANQIKPGDKVTLVEPMVMPDELLDPVCEVLKGNESVASAYLQIMIVNDTIKSYLLVLDGPQDEALFASVANAARDFLVKCGKEGRQMDLNLTTSAAPLGQQGMAGSEPFYRRGEGRIYDDDEDE